MKRKLLVVLAVLAVTCWAAVASADSITFNLTTGNSGGLGGFTGPFATVTVNLNSGTIATITFHSLTNGGYTYLMGGQGAFAVNVNAASWTYSLTGTGFTNSFGSAFSPGSISDGGAGNEDGFGSFNQTFNSFDGFGHSGTNAVFTLTNTSGIWASATSVLNGQIAAIHGFATTNTSGTLGTSATNTGYASDAQAVPIPPTALLLGSGLVGLAGLGWRRRRKG